MRRWVRRGIVVLLLLVAAIALGLAILYWASRREPEFYAKAAMTDPSKAAAASDEMVRKTTALASDMRKRGPWRALFTEQQINGWLAVDLEKNYPGLLPPQISEPRVAIHPDELIVGCRFENGRIKTVLWINLNVYLAEPNVVALQIRKVRAGLVPLPMKNVLDQVSSAARQFNLHLRWQQSGSDPVALIAIRPPENEKGKRLRIESLKLSEKEAYLAGTTQ